MASNPFEVHVNRQKHKVLGRKLMRWETGKPNRSHHAAIKKRKESLLPELRAKNKSGRGLIDNRVKDDQGGVAARKAKLYDKFDIDDDEEKIKLTHQGEQLNESKLNQPIRIDDDDEDLDLLRRGDYVESAHFGGGESGQPLSSAEFLEEVMVDKRKKQLEKEENVKLTEQLDKDWTTIRNLIKHKGSKDETNNADNEDYDILLNQLMFGGMDEKPAPKIVTSTLEQREEKQISINMLIVENLRNMMNSDNVDTILNHINFLLSFEVKRFNSAVIGKLVNLLNGKEIKKCSLKSLGLLMFALTFKELKDFSTIKLVGYLRTLKYDSFVAIGKRLIICDLLDSFHPDKYFPEIIVSLTNILTLFSPDHASLFTPSFAFEKLAKPLIDKNDDNLSFNDLPTFNLKTVFDGSLEPTVTSSLSTIQVKSLIFKVTLDLIERLISSYKKLDSYEPIFSGISKIFSTLQEKLPDDLSDRVYMLIDSLSDCDMLQCLIFEKVRPNMITMLEPRLPNSFAAKKGKDEKKKLARSYKREYKSATRELRKDGAFIRDVVLKDTIAKDAKRKQKVKKLMAEIAEERSMFKKKR